MDTILAVISGDSLIRLFVTIVIAGLIYFILNWALTAIAIPEPFSKIIRVIIILAAAFFLIDALLAISGHPLISWR